MARFIVTVPFSPPWSCLSAPSTAPFRRTWSVGKDNRDYENPHTQAVVDVLGMLGAMKPTTSSGSESSGRFRMPLPPLKY